MIITVALIVFHVLGFLSSIHAVMSTRTSQGAIAWVVSLNTFPYVAVPGVLGLWSQHVPRLRHGTSDW